MMEEHLITLRIGGSLPNEQGFESRLCTPEHPEGKGLAQRFMGILVKMIHAAKAEMKDLKLEQRLLS